MWPFLRVIIGGVFIISGRGKVLTPYQNFLYVVQAYQLLPSWAELLVARTFPWIELIAGIFILLGLWLPWALKVASALFGIFVLVVGQALIRNLPLESCGCFGEWIHLKPQVTIFMDILGLGMSLQLLRCCDSAQKFSLDSYFDQV